MALMVCKLLLPFIHSFLTLYHLCRRLAPSKSAPPPASTCMDTNHCETLNIAACGSALGSAVAEASDRQTLGLCLGSE